MHIHEHKTVCFSQVGDRNILFTTRRGKYCFILFNDVGLDRMRVMAVLKRSSKAVSTVDDDDALTLNAQSNELSGFLICP